MRRCRIAALAVIVLLSLPAAVALSPTDTVDESAESGPDGAPTVTPVTPVGPEDPKDTVEELLGEEADEEDPGGGGSDGWWDWEDVGNVGSNVGDALTSTWGLAAVALGALSAGGAWWYGGARLTTPEEVLENEVRSNIYEYVRETTGAHLHQISEDLDLSTTNAVWHLRKLQEAGLVESKKFNGYRIFYPVEGGVEAQKLSIGVNVLGNDNARRIFEHLAREPGHHQRQIARSLDINHGTVRWHLRKMRKAEMVVETKKGNATKYFPTDLGREALTEIGGAVPEPEPVEAPAADPTPA